ncbi:thiol:disulfide interchange protein DsbA/DsbL [Parashewanella spongiae]|uniref:Thiol:disulfide interchange protein n=2 Tax=Parashewanella spongiae TaxID=342950 RepID=A0A3A6TNC1_9GAMM|nr:thiol:disulfide interchange protein DsbA/DsbL [Parashewanella spongiae]
MIGSASAADYIKGKDYIEVTGIPELQQPIVREFFSYNCPHCYNEDSTMNKMAELLQGDVTFTRTPVGAGRSSWILAQEAFFVAKKIKIYKQVHSKIFHRIHEEGGPFTTSGQLKTFFMKQGVTAEQFDKAYNSSDKQAVLSNYETKVQLAEIRGVPSLLINGKYEVNPGNRSAQELAGLVRYLSNIK